MNRDENPAPVPSATARPSFVVRFPFAIPALFIGATLVAAVIGLVRHNLGWWSVGMNSVGLQGMGPLGRWFTRRRGRPASVREQVSDNYRGLAIVFPFTFAVTIGFMLLFPTWFPASCPLPPRHRRPASFARDKLDNPRPSTSHRYRSLRWMLQRTQSLAGPFAVRAGANTQRLVRDRKSTRLNSSHTDISRM